MTTFQSLLLSFLIALTVLNIISRKKKKESYIKYREKIEFLKEKARKDLKHCCSSKLLMYPFMSDSNDYYLIGVEEKYDIIAIITEHDTYKMKISSPRKSETVLIEDDKHVKAVISRVSCSDLGHDIDVYLSRKTNRKKSFFCKLAKDNSETFNQRIENPLE